MARKLKVYQTSQGFYDLAVAAPSMKAALEAWGAASYTFEQGHAQESTDAKVREAALKHPNVVLRRPVGTSGPFQPKSETPSPASREQQKTRLTASPPKSAESARIDRDVRGAAKKSTEEQREREKQAKRDAQATARANQRRMASVARVEKELENAQRDHDEIQAKIDDDRASLQRRADAEEKRWALARSSLEGKLRTLRE